MRSVYPAPRTKPAPSLWGVLPALLLLGAAVILALTVLWRPEPPTGPPEAIFPLPERYAGNYERLGGGARAGQA